MANKQVKIYHPDNNKLLGDGTLVNGSKVYPAYLKQASSALTLDQLKLIVGPGARRYYDSLLGTLERYDIVTPARVAHFLAQVAHESASFKFVEENLHYSPDRLAAFFSRISLKQARAANGDPKKNAELMYGNRKDLGNIYKGDGWKFRGRGFIQLTGRFNYKAYGKSRGMSFVSSPDLVATDQFAFDVAGWYWNSRNLNDLADANDIKAITKKINGGFNGLDDRIYWTRKISKIL